MEAIRISIYLIALILSNFIVLWFGRYGLIFTALFLIPFDFVMRCIFHENWKGWKLIKRLLPLIVVSSIITLLINYETKNIAIASSVGFISSQICAGIFYQLFISKPYYLKVNGSDLIGIIADSILFQLIAFSSITPLVTISQILLKFIGGIFWYWIIFIKFKLYDNR